jgi:hypothetical protein
MMIHAIFTEREFQDVRRCCRDADAGNPLRAFDAATARAEALPSPPIPDTDPAPPPSEPQPQAKPPLPPHPARAK